MLEHRQDHISMHRVFWIGFSKLTATSTCTTIIFGPEQQGMYSWSSQGKWHLQEFLYRGISRGETWRVNGMKKITHHPNNNNIKKSSHTLSLKFLLSSSFHRKQVLSKVWVAFFNKWYILVSHGFSQPLEQLLLIKPFPAHIGFHGFYSSWEWSRGYPIIGLHKAL